MERINIDISGIPAILWGSRSEACFIYVHGKMGCKEYAESFARIAAEKGYQTLSFDLPEHGERKNSPERCDVRNGIRDLNVIADYVFERWQRVSLYACSLGAYFSLNAYAEGERGFEKCLFQSPIVDMEWLVRSMMKWAGVTEEQLEREKEIFTPTDTLRWDYYRYILSHPQGEWKHPTSILYAALDDLQPETSVRAFAEKNGCSLTVSADSRHPFMEPEDIPIVEGWLAENIAYIPESKKVQPLTSLS